MQIASYQSIVDLLQIYNVLYLPFIINWKPDLSCIHSPQNWGPDKQGAVKIADKSSFNYVPI